jgi:thiol-disulfide isomerase/thioredoxin
MKNLIVTFLCFLYVNLVFVQTINGSFPTLASKVIKLSIFNGFQTKDLDSVIVDNTGDFNLTYNSNLIGIGVLTVKDEKPLFVILDHEEIELVGEAFISEFIQFNKGKQNQQFSKYANEYPMRLQAINAWDYLNNLYQKTSVFDNEVKIKNTIQKEKQRILKEDSMFLSKLDPKSYVSWFLPTRKLVSSVSYIAQYDQSAIPATLNAFRQMNYSDPRLYVSGLLKDAIESHYWLLENSGKPLEEMFAEMNRSTDALIQSLMGHDKVLNEITNFLFDLLERHSLFSSSEYLAIKLLNTTGCSLNDELAKQLETYRTMKKGNRAPEIEFKGSCFLEGKENYSITKLSTINAKQKLIVFGASWCPSCKQELPKIAEKYIKWKQKGLEVIFISLDEDKQLFAEFVKNFPFFSFCDFNKWESKAAKDYYVFGTPTMFLIDQNQTILIRPTSIDHVDTWVNYYLK